MSNRFPKDRQAAVRARNHRLREQGNNINEAREVEMSTLRSLLMQRPTVRQAYTTATIDAVRQGGRQFQPIKNSVDTIDRRVTSQRRESPAHREVLIQSREDARRRLGANSNNHGRT